LIAGLLAAVALYQTLASVNELPAIIIRLLDILYATRRAWLLLLALLPLAMTMTLLWKTKEVVLSSIFGNKDFLTPPPKS